MIYKLKKFLYYHYRQFPHYYRDYKFFKKKQIRLYNWYKIDPDFWLCRFINERDILNNSSKSTLSIFSVFGYRINARLDRSDYKIFFTGENVHSTGFAFRQYDDLLLNEKSINLSLGFDYIENERYMRFPLWLIYLFEPNESLDSIRKKCEQINTANVGVKRTKFCSFLCNLDRFGLREKFYQKLSSLGPIDCDGIFRHNNDDLKKVYNDNKIEYLKNYRFNLCPENSNESGYCTEKVFEAILGGCIPVYWGTNNNPEPEILNHKAIIFIDPDKDCSNSLDLIDRLNNDDELYKSFAMQPRLLPNAAEIIYNYFQDLEGRLRKLIAE